jgi:hypothetical protein
MHTEPTTGVPNPDKPGQWLVPPWATNTSFSDVVRHFLRFNPWGDTSTAHLLAYFQGYQAALDAAPTDTPASSLHWRWCQDMRDCVGRCTTLYQKEHAAEIQQAKVNVSTLRRLEQQISCQRAKKRHRDVGTRQGSRSSGSRILPANRRVLASAGRSRRSVRFMGMSTQASRKAGKAIGQVWTNA